MRALISAIALGAAVPAHAAVIFQSASVTATARTDIISPQPNSVIVGSAQQSNTSYLTGLGMAKTSAETHVGYGVASVIGEIFANYASDIAYSLHGAFIGTDQKGEDLGIGNDYNGVWSTASFTLTSDHGFGVSITASNPYIFAEFCQSGACYTAYPDATHSYFTFANSAPLTITLSQRYSCFSDTPSRGCIVSGGGVHGSSPPFTSSASYSLSVSPVVEPSSWLLMILGVGLGGIALRRRRAEPVRRCI